MRTPNWLLPVFIGLAGIAGCTVEITTSTSTTSPTPTTAITSSAPASPATAGNGIDQLEAQEIIERAWQATTSAKSVRVRGNVTDGGEVIGVDMLAAGSKAAGRFDLDGQRLELILDGKDLYIKGDKAFWTSTADEEIAKLFAGKYLKTRVDDKDFADLATLASLPVIFGQLPDADDFTGATKGSPTKINGVPAIPVGYLNGAKFYVATEGKPYILRLDVGNGKDHVDFLDYGKTPDVRPPADQVVDLDQLGGRVT